jgi:DNA-binding transcriptional LysR family regulator
MNFKIISYFVEIAKSGSFSEAALRNHISLPAISQAIKRLESELGFSLFMHGKNRFALSQEGEEFLGQAEFLLKSWQEIKKGTSPQSERKRNVDTISLAAPASLYNSFLVEELAIICAMHKFHLRLVTGSSRSIRNFLEDRVCDFAICLDDPFLRDFASESLFRGRFGIYQKKDRGDKEGVIVGDFGREVRNLNTFYQKKFGRPLPVLAEVASWDLIAQLVELGAGQGLLPDFHKTTRRKNIVKVFEQYPGDPYEVKIYAQPNSSNKLMGFLLERLKKRIPPVLNKKP